MPRTPAEKRILIRFGLCSWDLDKIRSNPHLIDTFKEEAFNELERALRQFLATHESEKNLRDKYRRLLDDKREPVYAYFWSRDCDMCESQNVAVYRSFRDFCKSEDDFYEGLEGPGTFREISKEEYDEFKACSGGPIVRDRVLEAFENGNIAPYKV